MKRPCEGPVSLTTEVDGLRCVCNTTTTLLRRVPDALVKVCVDVCVCACVCDWMSITCTHVCTHTHTHNHAHTPHLHPHTPSDKLFLLCLECACAYTLQPHSPLHAHVHPQVYKPGSTSPAAQLLDARDLFDGGSARADLVLRSIADHLGEAVEGCAAAAGLDLSVQRQKALMRAAVFGRAFAPEVPPGLLRDVALKLRVMNALRDAAVGLPLTMPQLEALTLPVVVSRYDVTLSSACHA
jgi:hypothetical protein